jgi:hypothetical protein
MAGILPQFKSKIGKTGALGWDHASASRKPEADTVKKVDGHFECDRQQPA